MARVRFVLWVLLTVGLPAVALAAPTGKIVIAQGVDPTTLDAMNQFETPSMNVVAQIYDSLVDRDEKLMIVPALAAELPKLVASNAWEFKLRRGVKFHNGEDFSAASVKFSLERLINPTNKLRGATLFAPLDRVEVIDDYTVRVHTRKPWPLFSIAMSFRQASMYPPKAYAGKDPAYISKNPIGTGPYRLMRWVKDEEIILEANEQYWRGAPRIKTVVFRPIPDDAVRVASLQNGEIDIAVNIPPHFANIIANHPRLFLSTAPSVRTIQLMFYTHQFDPQHKLVGPYQGPTADKRIRQAIASAVDADEIIRAVLDGKGLRIATLLTSMHFGFDPAIKPSKPDLGQARRLLSAAGYPNGLELALNAPQGRYLKDKEVAEVVAGQLAKAGIRTTVRTHEFVTYLNNFIYVHKAGPVWLIGWGAPSLQPENVYIPLFRSGSSFSNYANPEFDQLADEAQTTMDEKRRRTLWQRASRLLVDDAAVVPLYQQVDLYGVSKRLRWASRSDELIRAYDIAPKDAK